MRRHRRTARAVLVLVVAVLALLVVAGRPVGFALTGLLGRLISPDTRTVSAGELEAWRADRHRVKPLLLDARTAPEYSVSHLPGAWRIEPGETRFEALKAPQDTPIVVYSAADDRSARIASRLATAGFRDVSTLDGGIFAWANELRPLAASEGPARTVHPFNFVWGWLLAPPLRADEPGAAGIFSLP